MTNYGTLTLFDQAAASTPVQEFGESAAYQTVRADLDAYNAAIGEATREVSTPTDAYQLPYGTVGGTEMIESDEFTIPDAQKSGRTATVGFPLRKYTYAIQWTRVWMLQNTIADLEREYLAARGADYQNLLRATKRAIFTPTNTASYVDRLATRNTYALRALLNADGLPIPNGPNGEVFDGSTHTHYLANSGLNTTVADQLINTVIEHGHGGAVRVYINRAQEAAWRGLAGFAAYVDARIVQPSTATYARTALDVTRLDNRAIGVYGGAEIWTKPWVPSGYAFCFDTSSPKPLAFRTRAGGLLSNLSIDAEYETYPLRAQFMGREFGLAPWTRSNGAVLYTGGGSYVTPTFA